MNRRDGFLAHLVEVGLLACPQIAPAQKDDFTQQYLPFDPVALMRQMVTLEDQLLQAVAVHSLPTQPCCQLLPALPKPGGGSRGSPLTSGKRKPTQKEVTPPPHFEYICPEATITRFEYFSK